MSGYDATDALMLLVREVTIGAVGGIAVGYATVWLLRRLPLPSAGIAPVVTLSAALAGYVGRLGAGGLRAAGRLPGRARDRRCPDPPLGRDQRLPARRRLARAAGAVRAAGPAGHPPRPGPRGTRAAHGRASHWCWWRGRWRCWYARRPSVCGCAIRRFWRGRTARRRPHRVCHLSDRRGHRRAESGSSTSCSTSWSSPSCCRGSPCDGRPGVWMWSTGVQPRDWPNSTPPHWSRRGRSARGTPGRSRHPAGKHTGRARTFRQPRWWSRSNATTSCCSPAAAALSSRTTSSTSVERDRLHEVRTAIQLAADAKA